ncbi:MAG: hypothetical protein FWB91_10740 [Defluviitaleaceae bacterium]|nr:hypothetical protein [Defluviitaleaceae bacterium]
MNIDTLTKIKRITRQKSYKTLSHEALAKDVNLESSNRSEELMVIWQRNFRAWQGVRFSDSFEKCTYWCIADRQKLLGDFGYPNAELRKGILAYNPSRPYTDFNECKKVRELMVKLDVDFFVLSADNTRVIPFGAVSTTAPDIGDTSGAKTP